MGDFYNNIIIGFHNKRDWNIDAADVWVWARNSADRSFISQEWYLGEFLYDGCYKFGNPDKYNIFGSDPMFVDEANSNYRLRDGSPCMGAGRGGVNIGLFPDNRDTQLPVISSVASKNITSTGAAISWSTNEPADTQVEYGPTTGYGTPTPLDASLVQSHSVIISGLSANTPYHYRVKSKDAAGNLAASGDLSFTTAPADIQPPVISSVAKKNVTSSSATITWVTNELADSQVEYGPTTSFGTLTPLDGTLTKTHSVALSGLKAGKTYYYRVRSKDAHGNLRLSGRYSFKTAAATSGIDLIPDALWWSPDPVKAGNSVTIGFRVKNIGAQSAGAFHIQLKRDGTPICGWDVPGLAPNQVFERGPGIGGSACSDYYGIPSAEVPGYNISFVVDDLNRVGETNEGNNTMTKYMSVSN
jgi:hypothetical protein